MKRKLLLLSMIAALLLALLPGLIFPATVWADGSEELGPPTLPVQSKATGLVLSGVTPCDCGKGDMQITVPENVTVTQVLLYWYVALQNNNSPRNDITIDEETVMGTTIGGPTIFWDNVYFTAFRSDVTSLGWITPGANHLTVDLPFTPAETIEEAVGIVVLYDDGQTREQIYLRDGLDLAFFRFAAPLDRTTPQSFTFAPAPHARTAHLYLWLGSLEAERPYRVEIDVGAEHREEVRTACLICGRWWEPAIITQTIPANVSNLTVQLFSQEQDNPLGASLEWMGASLVIPEPTPPLVKLEIGRESTFRWWYTVTNTGNVALAEVVVRAAQGVDLTCTPGATTLNVGETMVCAAESNSCAKCATLAWVYGKPVGGGRPLVQWLPPEGCIGP